MNLTKAAEFLGISCTALRHAAQRGEIHAPIILFQTALGSFLTQLLKAKLPNNSSTAFNTILTPTKPI
jgi:hypothetical protein